MGTPLSSETNTRACLIRVLVAIVGWCGAATAASAQTSRYSLDVAAMTDVDKGSQVVRHNLTWIDVFGSVRIADGLDFRARPVVIRRTFDGTWQTQMYELGLRYERRGRVNLRLDAGQMVSPLGLAILENRPDTNPVISQHSTMYLPVPRFEAGTPTQFLYAASYPFGAQATVSGAKWDARVALTDSSPVRNRPFFGDNKPARVLNTIVGGGITPRIGLRFGASFASGPYATATEVRNPSKGDREATLAQVESEWQFGYTRVAGEYLWTRRETAVDDARAHGGWIEAVHTFAPRVFGVVRYDHQRTHWTSQPDLVPRKDIYHRLETTVGYRVSPGITLRASYMTRKGYVVRFWDDQMLASIVFARRLF